MTPSVLDLAPPGPEEVLVRLRASGVCHSDWNAVDGTAENRCPCVLGHEGAGVVEEVGPGVSSVAPGDHVIPLYIPECRECRYCLSGRTNLCVKLRATQGKGVMPDGSSRLSHQGRLLHHYMGTSTFAECTVLPEIALAKIRPDAPLDKVCLLGCAVTTGIGAVLHTAKVEPGSSVAVFGLGGVGLSVIQGAAIAGAERIIAIDTMQAKLDMAKTFGATDVLLAKEGEDLAKALKKLTGGGPDYAFECVGVGALAEAAYRAIRRGGKAIVVGVARPTDAVSFKPMTMVFEEKTLQGSYFGSCVPRIDFPRMLHLYMGGRLKLDELITRRYRIEEAPQAFADLASGKNARGVIVF